MAGAKGLDLNNPHNIFIHSFQPFNSPIDGEVIKNTKQLREHENRHQVKQVGNDFINKRKREQ